MKGIKFLVTRNFIKIFYYEGINIMLADFHIHTCFSGDSEADVDKIIESAIEKGMRYMAITDHNDFEFENGTFELDVERYFKCISDKKAEYKRQIQISVGIECGLEPRYKNRIDNLLNAYNFDFVIGSSHVINGKDPYYKEYFEGRSVHEAMVEYLLSIEENIDIFDNFDVYGHLDYMMRYAPVPVTEKHYCYDEYGEYYERILTKLINNGKGVEINTSALKSGQLDTNPNFEVIKRYAELGGKIITIGSDAHSPEYIGYGFEVAEYMLKKAGFTCCNIFEKRVAKPLQLL